MDKDAGLDPADFLLAQAREAARTLVREQLAACANVLPGVTSIYVWREELSETEEVLVLFKTHRQVYPALETRLRSIHPYEVPEIVTVGLTAGLPAYLEWVATGVFSK